MRSIQASAVVLVALSSACASSIRPLQPAAFEGARRHSVFVDGDGRPIIPDTVQRSTTLTLSADDERVYGVWVHGILEGLRASGRHDVLLRIHGGNTPLNLFAADTGTTAQIMRESPYYPIFVNWESSIPASYLDQLLYIRGTRAYRGWDPRGIWLSPLYLVSDAGRAVAHAPVTWSVQGRKFFGGLRATDGIASQTAKRQQAALFPNASVEARDCKTKPSSNVAQPIHVEYGHDCRSGWERALQVGIAVVTTVGVMPYDRNAGRFGHNAIGRFSIKLPSHLFWPEVKLFSPWASEHIAWLPLRPIVGLLIDMVGPPAYDNMHRRTRMMFRPANDVAAADANPLAYRPAPGAVAQLLDSLQAFVATTADTTEPDRCTWSAGPSTVVRAKGDPFRVTIVGASLGANVAGEIVHGCPGIRFRNIVFLGSAATQRDVERDVLPYLRADSTARFFNVTLNPAADRNEWPSGVFFAPQGSLVEWLDGFMKTPSTDEDRVFGKYENAISA
ncbi:MAG TPA: hypothetical protein VH559_01995, partial [Gemmatimonadaceae bacterium]